MNDTKMTLEEFLENLPRLDWLYNMSDDHSAWKRGRDQVERYRLLALSMGGEWQDAFFAESERHKV